MAENIKQSAKKRNWAFVVYPESAPKDWKEILALTGLRIAISPLHDRDVNPDGTPKKPHWHVIAVYSGPTAFNVVRNLTERLSAPIPQALEAVKGYFRYLTHRDNPEKAQYAPGEITYLNGFSPGDFDELTRSEVNETKKEILATIRAVGMVEYSQLVEWAMTDGRPEQFDIVVNHTIFFDRYLSSRRHLQSPAPARTVGSVIDEI